MLLQLISQQSITTETFISDLQEYIDESAIVYSGSYGNLCVSKSIWHNGVTYITAKGNNPTEDPYLLRWKNGVMSSIKVGFIDYEDALSHQNATILIIDDYIYIFCVNGHGESIKIWKSNTIDMLDGFSLHHTIVGNFGYCNTEIYDGNVVITSRVTDNQTYIYSQVLLVSDGSDLTTWDKINTTDADYSNTDVRHYPSMIKHYGYNEWHYSGISLRNDDESPQVYFGKAIYKTKDFTTVYNLDETFSKDISSTPLTVSEIEDYFMISGTNTAKTTYNGTMSAIAINDIIYTATYENSQWSYLKIVNGSITKTDCELPDLPTTANGGYHFIFYFNGINIVFQSRGKIYATDLNFTTIEEKFEYYELGEPTGANTTVLPANLDEIYGKYIIGGSSLEEGVVPYYISNKKFFI